MSTEEDAAANVLAHPFDGAFESQLIAFGGMYRRTMRTRLSKRQVAAQHGDSSIAQCSCHTDEQRRLAIRAGTVCEHQSVSWWMIRLMKEATHWRIERFDKNRLRIVFSGSHESGCFCFSFTVQRST